MIIIVGAGLAGLTCAKHLVAAGQQVLVLEADRAVGGRVRTDLHPDGYRLDRGFQVLFTAYPAVQRDLVYDSLKPRLFEPGALLVQGKKHYMIADPTRQPETLLADLSNPLISMLDKVRVLRLRQELANRSLAAIFQGEGQPEGKDESTERYLQRLGFTEQGFIEHFARPFFGGIFLDRSLATSGRLFQFIFKMLARGEIMIPAEGMQAIPDQLAATLPTGTIRFQAPVRELLLREEKVHGVLLENGEQIEADQVIVATESPTAAKLTGLPLPTAGVGCTCLYFAGDERLYTQRAIALRSTPTGIVNHTVLLTNIAPTYAPPKKHLLSLTVLGNVEDDDEALARRCLSELGEWFPDHDLSRWRFLASYRIPFSQFAQKPGIFEQLPANQTRFEGLYLAGDYTQSSSIQGAMQSGVNAARAVLDPLRQTAHAS